MTTLNEDLQQLNDAWLDLAYQLVKPMLPVFDRLGRELKPWVRERQIRDLHNDHHDPQS
jgi:hypothetical protein